MSKESIERLRNDRAQRALAANKRGLRTNELDDAHRAESLANAAATPSSLQELPDHIAEVLRITQLSAHEILYRLNSDILDKFEKRKDGTYARTYSSSVADHYLINPEGDQAQIIILQLAGLNPATIQCNCDPYPKAQNLQEVTDQLRKKRGVPSGARTNSVEMTITLTAEQYQQLESFYKDLQRQLNEHDRETRANRGIGGR